jgi:hypothetical protein
MWAGMRTGFVLVIVAAAGAAAALTYKISKETGKSLTEAATDVPAEANRYWDDVRQRGEQAVQAGRDAARKKQEEIEQRLQAKA